jgi:Lon protease-like protein
MPHELLPLHIFEPRYREMLADISVGKKLFGVSMFEPEGEFEDRPAIGSIGCTAELRESEALPDERHNILTVGIIRYRITDYIETGSSYIVAKVDFFEDEPDDSAETAALAEEVFKLFERVARAAHNLSGQRGELPEIPKAPPEQLSFLVSAAFNQEPSDKYEIIVLTSTSERLKRIRAVLKDSVNQVEESAKIDRISRTNGHANKKIDLGP